MSIAVSKISHPEPRLSDLYNNNSRKCSHNLRFDTFLMDRERDEQGDNDKLLNTNTDDIEMGVIDDDVISILKDLKFTPLINTSFGLDNLKDNLSLIHDRKATLAVLRHLRDNDSLMYDTVLTFNPSNPEFPNLLDFHTTPLELQVKTMLVNLSIHKVAVCNAYEKSNMKKLSETLKYYALGSKLGLYQSGWIIITVLLSMILFGVLFIGFLVSLDN